MSGGDVRVGSAVWTTVDPFATNCGDGALMGPNPCCAPRAVTAMLLVRVSPRAPTAVTVPLTAITPDQVETPAGPDTLKFGEPENDQEATESPVTVQVTVFPLISDVGVHNSRPTPPCVGAAIPVLIGQSR